MVGELCLHLNFKAEELDSTYVRSLTHSEQIYL